MEIAKYWQISIRDFYWDKVGRAVALIPREKKRWDEQKKKKGIRQSNKREKEVRFRALTGFSKKFSTIFTSSWIIGSVRNNWATKFFRPKLSKMSVMGKVSDQLLSLEIPKIFPPWIYVWSNPHLTRVWTRESAPVLLLIIEYFSSLANQSLNLNIHYFHNTRVVYVLHEKKSKIP